MGWSAQYFTTIIIEGNTPQTGIFIYNGTPSQGTLIGSWTPAAGTDAFGNPYPAGINVFQGQLTGVTITQSTATVLDILASTITSSTINATQINQGQILETTIIFDSGGGQLFGYTSTTNTVTQSTPGDYNWTSPITGTASVFCIGAGAGGDGGTTSHGGSAGGAGECAGEPNYAVVNGDVYDYTVGQGGANSSTGNGNGAGGTDSFFDVTGPGVYANAGNGDGTPGTGSTNSVHFDGGTGGAASSFGGGASGGNSGNKTAKGNNGLSSTSSTHAGAPAGQTGSGTGGAGGDSGGNASNGATPGGGGGGAGQGSGTGGTLTKTYEAVYTASYYGPDATNGNPNGLRSTSTLYQGGETASGGAANGNQRCVMTFNIDQIESDFAGYTPANCVLKLTNLHSWYSSGMTVEFNVGQAPTKYPASPPGTWLGNQNVIGTGTIGEGDTHSYALGATVANALMTGATNFLGLGASIAEFHPYDLSYYGYFQGGHGTGLEITLSGTQTVSGSTNSGTGGNGNVTIVYATSSILEFALSPQSGTDPNGNAFAAGYTGPSNVYDPNNPGVVETWHDLTLSNSWAAQATHSCQIKLIGYNLAMIRLQLNAGSATSGTICTLPAGYRPATLSNFIVATRYLNAQPQDAEIIQVGTGSSAGLVVLNWAAGWNQLVCTAIITLD